jgi:hypothetical protein
MATLDNNFKGKIAQRAAALAQTVLNGLVREAVHDGEVFLQQAENDLSEWMLDLRNGDITQKNFESLVRDKKDLAEMGALKRAGLGKVAIDTFVNGFVQIVINAALDAVRIP